MEETKGKYFNMFFNFSLLRFKSTFFSSFLKHRVNFLFQIAKEIPTGCTDSRYGHTDLSAIVDWGRFRNAWPAGRHAFGITKIVYINRILNYCKKVSKVYIRSNACIFSEQETYSNTSIDFIIVIIGRIVLVPDLNSRTFVYSLILGVQVDVYLVQNSQ